MHIGLNIVFILNAHKLACTYIYACGTIGFMPKSKIIFIYNIILHSDLMKLLCEQHYLIMLMSNVL